MFKTKIFLEKIDSDKKVLDDCQEFINFEVDSDAMTITDVIHSNNKKGKKLESKKVNISTGEIGMIYFDEEEKNEKKGNLVWLILTIVIMAIIEVILYTQLKVPTTPGYVKYISMGVIFVGAVILSVIFFPKKTHIHNVELTIKKDDSKKEMLNSVSDSLFSKKIENVTDEMVFQLEALIKAIRIYQVDSRIHQKEKVNFDDKEFIDEVKATRRELFGENSDGKKKHSQPLKLNKVKESLNEEAFRLKNEQGLKEKNEEKNLADDDLKANS
ncbi:MAG: hypothetical protein PHO86_03070 [Bacilli bacterium]|nr:hypothetical protein [Bacilli bacterium]